MTPEARSRIQTAVEHSPDRRCVTLRRDDGSAMLAEIDRLNGGATRAESHMAENHRLLAEQERELSYLRSTVESEAAKIAHLAEERDDLKAGLLETTAALRSVTTDRDRYFRERAEVRREVALVAQQRDLAERQLTDTVRIPKADLFASWPVLWMSWALLPITGLAAYLAPRLHHG